MRFLIVEDDLTSRKLIQTILAGYGECDIAADGKEAVDAFQMSWVKNRPYDLICMDIMMPNMDGQEALKEIRNIENDLAVKPQDEVKVIMTTALDEPRNVFDSIYVQGASAYLVKPIKKRKLIRELINLRLITNEDINLKEGIS